MTDDATVSFSTEIPRETYDVLRSRGLYRDRLSEDARRALAAQYFQDRTLSLGQAANLAGLPLWTFIEWLSARGIAVIDLDDEEFAEELAAVEALSHQPNSD